MSTKPFASTIIFCLLAAGGCFNFRSSPMDQVPAGIEHSSNESEGDTRELVPKAVAFKPPNPDRENPFSMPGVTEAPAAAGKILGESGIKVLVYGFAKAPIDPSKNSGDPTTSSELRAILSVDGHRTTLGLDQEQRGIKVVKIDPPLVTLQSGNFVWTASMFDATSTEKK